MFIVGESFFSFAKQNLKCMYKKRLIIVNKH